MSKYDFLEMADQLETAICAELSMVSLVREIAERHAGDAQTVALCDAIEALAERAKPHAEAVQERLRELAMLLRKAA